MLVCADVGDVWLLTVIDIAMMAPMLGLTSEPAELGFVVFIFHRTSITGSDMPLSTLASQCENGRGFCDYRCVFFIALLVSSVPDICFVRYNQGIGGLVGQLRCRHECNEPYDHVFVCRRLPDMWRPPDGPLPLVGPCALLWGMSVSDVGGWLSLAYRLFFGTGPRIGRWRFVHRRARLVCPRRC